jgi:hypothetical protein
MRPSATTKRSVILSERSERRIPVFANVSEIGILGSAQSVVSLRGSREAHAWQTSCAAQ